MLAEFDPSLYTCSDALKLSNPAEYGKCQGTRLALQVSFICIFIFLFILV